MTLELLKSKNHKAFYEVKNNNAPLDFRNKTIYNSAPIFKIKIKSLFDRSAALFGIIILFPFLLLISILIFAETHSFPIFGQYRTGLMGRPFKIWKFRTMYVSDTGNLIKQVTHGDIRVTKLGRFLRKTSIDELPQLFNVLMGQMSLIGPRPHAIAHDIYYSGIIQNYDIRYLAKPGMSGLAQINGFRGPTEQIIKMENRIRKDCEYIENWSLKLDFKILIRTFFCLDSQNAV